MKITFTEHRILDALNMTVKPGDVLEASPYAPPELLYSYVQNGIAISAPTPIEEIPNE
jgi:hypothetical protein